ncbi:glutathione peroxidase [Olsenella umbonata]|uniref:Glutathione peroxidase n=1 Tax=Parafannyhessea umbonata TaxID=604330 RepID=A0A7X9TBD0_9ACTN|nr:glutathione peroxidase [Parafannyhessea umbonata]NMF26342.1 glutathione peroxidase [Parafannyhessea umbonata]
MSYFDYTVTNRDGSTTNLRQYAGKVLLIVNTATGCGFTPQYDDLEAIYKKYRDQGFEVLDFPCNQFAGQAPESDDDIHSFCTMKFGTEFPQFKKIDVNGDNADPLFADLATEKPFQGFGRTVKALALKKFADANNKKFGDKAYIMWNFTKFLVDREGNLVERFEPTVDMAEVEKAVAQQL